MLGGGNTAMDCCRTARRLGGEDVKVIVRSGFEEMKASPWEKEDAIHEDIPILNFMVPKAFTHDNGKLTGVTFEVVEAVYDAKMIEQRLEAFARGGVTVTVIDTASGINAATTAAIRHCDLCLVPARPSERRAGG